MDKSVPLLESVPKGFKPPAK
jgi:hypothetical protein